MQFADFLVIALVASAVLIPIIIAAGVISGVLSRREQ